MIFAQQISSCPSFSISDPGNQQIPAVRLAILGDAQGPVRQQLVDSAIAAVGEKGAPWPNLFWGID